MTEKDWLSEPPNRRDFLVVLGVFSLIVVVLTGLFAGVGRQPTPSPDPTLSTTVEPTIIAQTHAFPLLAPLPAVAFPLDNPYSEAKADLGLLLFFDTRMSGDGSFSCNSCHPASDGSWGISSPISFGYPGSTHWRNASTIINSAYYSKLNWDGSATSIEKQNNGAWTGAVAGNLDTIMAEERLAQAPEYVTMFNNIFGTGFPSYADALKAVATFERTITSTNVPFDAYLAGDLQAISEQAKRGYEMFLGRAGCIACHNGPLVSDDSFHNLGVPEYPGFGTNPLNQITFRYEQLAKGVPEAIYNTATRDLGLFYITKLESDMGKFRTPGLRDACYTVPYMHNGAFNTLAEVVAFYNQGGGEDANKDPLLQPLNLTAAQQNDLVSFLETLCGDKRIIESPELPSYAVWPQGDNGNEQ